VVVLVATSLLAMSNARFSSTINYVASALGIAIITFVLAVGFSHFDQICQIE
jgi:hypothetical protein